MATLSVLAQQDTWIDEESPSATHGSATTLLCYLSYGTQRETMIEFDIPATNLGTITQIDLMMYVTDVVTGLTLNMYRTANTTWLASTATWGNNSTNYTGSILDTHTSAEGTGWSTWGIYGANAINPYSFTWGDNVSLMIRESGSSSGWKGMTFASSEYTIDTALRPYLLITYTPSGGGFTPKTSFFL